MRRIGKSTIAAVATVGAVAVAFGLFTSGVNAADAEKSPEPTLEEASADVEPLGQCLADGSELRIEPVAKGGNGKGKGPKPKPEACCDPDAQPGVGGNPFCFEGASCCSDGNWRCNNADGSPSCSLGQVCT